MSNNNEKPNVYFRTSLRNTVLDVMSNQEGWVETTSEIDWDINWADIGWIRDNFDKLQFEDHQVRDRIPFDIMMHYFICKTHVPLSLSRN